MPQVVSARIMIAKVITGTGSLHHPDPSGTE